MATSLLALVFVKKAQNLKKGKVLASTLVNKASEKSGSLAISAIVSTCTYRCFRNLFRRGEPHPISGHETS